MDGDLFLLPMMLVHIAPLAGLEAVAEIEETDVVRPLRVRRRIGAVQLRSVQCRTGAVHLLSDPHSTGAAQPLHVLRRTEVLRWALRVAVAVC